jgi:hypothetical protein
MSRAVHSGQGARLALSPSGCIPLFHRYTSWQQGSDVLLSTCPGFPRRERLHRCFDSGPRAVFSPNPNSKETTLLDEYMSLTRQGGWHTLLCEGETQIGNSGTGVLTMQTLMHISTAGKRLFAVAWFCLIAGVPAICTEKTGGTLAIIPKPAKMEVYRGVFVIGPGTKVYLRVEDGGARRVGEYLSTLLSSSMGRTVPVQVAGGGTGRHRNSIYLLLKAPGTLGPEGYEMSVSPDAIRISATTVAGLFYGAQTLRQMLPPETQSHAPARGVWRCPACTSRTALASLGGG